jgi:hypothetical protein
MKTQDVRPQSYVKTLRCDRCERTAEAGEPEFHEFTSIDFIAGYGSILGDGSSVELDLCQHCLKDTLGQWLKVSEPGVKTACLQTVLDAFDARLQEQLEQHGARAGGLPTLDDPSKL